MLESLGVSPQDEELYRTLLRRPHATVEELADRTDHAEATVRRSLRRLGDFGLLTRLPGSPVRFLPVRPDVAVDVLVTRRQQELVQAQVAARTLVAEMATERPHEPEDLVEIVSGRGAVAHRFLQLEQTVASEFLVLDRPPYAHAPDDSDEYEYELLARGVRCRGIYAPEGLEIPGRLDDLRALVEAGEEARTSPVVPMKMAIADRSVAILPLSAEQVTGHALVVHASTLVDALVTLFEMLWERALPFGTAGHAGTAPESLDSTEGESGAHRDAGPSAARTEQDLLTLLAAGLSDSAIARQLEISPRTLSRHLASLMHVLGARTRFQAGVTAGRRGLAM